MRKLLLLTSVMVAASLASAQVNLIPNGGFEDADDSLTWIDVSGAGDAAPTTFTTGGNPDSYATVTPNGGWGILVSPVEPGTSGGGVPIGDLGLVAGGAVTFTWDSINLSGDGGGLGGMKVEAWGGNALLGNTGDQHPTPVGDGTAWETLTYDWTLPAGTDKLIFVPLWDIAAGETVGFDNVGVVVPEPSTFALLGGLGALGFVLYRRRKQA
jgi:hypothetical protein